MGVANFAVFLTMSIQQLDLKTFMFPSYIQPLNPNAFKIYLVNFDTKVIKMLLTLEKSPKFDKTIS